MVAKIEKSSEMFGGFTFICLICPEISLFVFIVSLSIESLFLNFSRNVTILCLQAIETFKSRPFALENMKY